MFSYITSKNKLLRNWKKEDVKSRDKPSTKKGFVTKEQVEEYCLQIIAEDWVVCDICQSTSTQLNYT
jgi:hypothetical protein